MQRSVEISYKTYRSHNPGKLAVGASGLGGGRGGGDKCKFLKPSWYGAVASLPNF